MEWTEVNIYTSADGIELLCAKLMDIGVKGFVIKDSEDFKEFLDNKNGQWDYIDDDLMGLANCETCVTVYLPGNEQGADAADHVEHILHPLGDGFPHQPAGKATQQLGSQQEHLRVGLAAGDGVAIGYGIKGVFHVF